MRDRALGPRGAAARLGLAGLLVGALGIAAVGSTAVAQTTRTVLAGGESPDGSTQVNQFLPGNVTVNVGDTITWRVASTEFHNVVFLSGAARPPFIDVGPMGPMLHPLAAFPSGGNTYGGSGIVGSGLLNQGDTFSLTFTSAGSFDYVCTIHGAMRGTVTVAESGGAVDAQATVDARATGELNAALANHGVPVYASNAQTIRATGSAAVAAGAGDDIVAINRFITGNVTIHEGDFVTWINKDPETPHTVTFLDGAEMPEVIMPVPQEGGPPLLLLNPQVLAPSTMDADYDGDGFHHSGFLSNEPPFPNTYTVRFTQVGTYAYLCLLHPGMEGTVTVMSNEALPPTE